MHTQSLFRCIIIIILSIAGSRICAQQANPDLQHIIDTTFAAHPGTTGMMVSVIPESGTAWNYATGVSDRKTGTKLQPDQPVLLASNTKTYIAAAILKLQEQHKLSIDDSIGRYLTAGTMRKMRNDGYATGKITLVHLLSHTSGIDDYVNDSYFDFVNSHREYHWTREEQIDKSFREGRPLALPGDTFKYADINYLLLTEIMEQVTHQPFYKTVRTLLRYRELNIQDTWFTRLEQKPGHTKSLAHQYWSKYPWDAYDLDPSWDLYGGGGIAATPHDLALFFKYLFEGKIIRDPKLLSRLYTPVMSKTPTNYCLGLRSLTIAGLTGYYHGGFWGTDAIYFPELKTTIVIVITERAEKNISADICKAIVETIKNRKPPR